MALTPQSPFRMRICDLSNLQKYRHGLRRRHACPDDEDIWFLELESHCDDLEQGNWGHAGSAIQLSIYSTLWNLG